MIVELAEFERSADQVSATPALLHDSLFRPNPQVFAHVVEDSPGALVGFALWFLNFSTWLGKHGIYLEDLYIRPQHRGTGLGRALLATLARECVEHDYGRLEWWVLDWNDPAIEFYRAHGAEAMDDWTVYRVRGQALKTLADAGPPT
jgi:GNAT superfamily N-acetyltransferase